MSLRQFDNWPKTLALKRITQSVITLKAAGTSRAKMFVRSLMRGQAQSRGRSRVLCFFELFPSMIIEYRTRVTDWYVVSREQGQFADEYLRYRTRESA